ncbi:MAG: lactonase family protein [Anaerolineae bacterium]|nr:lactonase family protein [Anaerolineae bacterium]
MTQPTLLSPPSRFVYIGTYTEPLDFVDGQGEGIYSYMLDGESGELHPANPVTTGLTNPSYLTLDPHHRYLYAVQETDNWSPDAPAVYAFAVEPESGVLRFLNQQPAYGEAPCHITTDNTGRWLLVANYGTGTVALYPVLEDGRLGSATDIAHHEGSSINADRQTGPHAHHVLVDATNRYVFVADLGLDKIMVYRLDSIQGRLIPHDPPFATIHAGAGPRHLAFHPSGRYLFVLNELDATLVTLAHTEGRLTPVQIISTLPAGAEARPSCAAIRVAPSGRFIYTSNRGHDSIALFAVDETTGRLTDLGHEPTGGQTPREIVIDPSGTFLLAANQDSHTIVTFRLDVDTGHIRPVGSVASIPSPVCVAFGQQYPA